VGRDGIALEAICALNSSESNRRQVVSVRANRSPSSSSFRWSVAPACPSVRTGADPAEAWCAAPARAATGSAAVAPGLVSWNGPSVHSTRPRPTGTTRCGSRPDAHDGLEPGKSPFVRPIVVGVADRLRFALRALPASGPAQKHLAGQVEGRKAVDFKARDREYGCRRVARPRASTWAWSGGPPWDAMMPSSTARRHQARTRVWPLRAKPALRSDSRIGRRLAPAIAQGRVTAPTAGACGARHYWSNRREEE
jgi:hypothetical protein